MTFQVSYKRLLDCTPAHRARLVKVLRDARDSYALTTEPPQRSFLARLLRKPEEVPEKFAADAIRQHVKLGIDLLRAFDIMSEAVGEDSLGKFEHWDRRATPARRIAAFDRAIQLAEEGYDGFGRCS